MDRTLSNVRLAEGDSLDRLVEIMARLRAPDGCPWDVEQTFETIAPYTLEEAYEVADAIAQGDTTGLKGELGDLLFQVVYHAQLASEAGHFALPDVIRAIGDKMYARHPHVFGKETRQTAAAQTAAWEAQKAAERQGRTLDGIALALPALTRAVKLQNRAARVGFDWPDAGHVLEKVAEEAQELTEAAPEDRAEEYGDLLFVMANLARHLDIDPEAALRAANAKFERRFRAIEDALAADGRSPADSDLAEMDRLWDQAKAAEKA